MSNNINIITTQAPTNIAVIKYWGKENIALNTPINSSLSVTLSGLYAITSVCMSNNFNSDKLWLNNIETIPLNKRILVVLSEIRSLAQRYNLYDKIDGKYFHIVSKNTFPTAAGLASSAAGYANLVFSLAKLIGLDEVCTLSELSIIARQGSGSASRSLFGGFAQWNKGELDDGSDSLANQIYDENYWPNLRALILVVSDQKKGTSSTSGMKTSVDTSLLLKYRAESIVDNRINDMIEAYKNHDFNLFGQITMQDSNQFHATCLDTFPPIFYMNDISRTIINLVHAYNDYYNEIKVAYTFDAGPNAVIYTLDEYVDEFLSIALYFYPACKKSYMNNMSLYNKLKSNYQNLNIDLKTHMEIRMGNSANVIGNVKMIYHTRPGPGPLQLEDVDSLIDENGFPLISNIDNDDNENNDEYIKEQEKNILECDNAAFGGFKTGFGLGLLISGMIALGFLALRKRK